MKTIYTFALTATLLFVPFAYPFAPIQLTLISSTASGIPGVFLALEPNFKRVPQNFMKTVLKRAILGAVTVFGGIMAVLIFGEGLGLSPEECSTICTIYTGTASLVTLLCSCLPLNKFKAVLIVLCSAIFFGGAAFFSELFMLVELGDAAKNMLLCMLPFTAVQLLVRGVQLRKEKT